MNNVKLFLQVIAISASVLFTSASESPQSEQPEVKITQIDTSEFPQVTLYMSVVDQEGNPMKVDPARLVIKENGKPIDSDQIEGVGAVDFLTTLLVTDASGSMNTGGKLEAAKAAAHEYVQQMRPGDQAGLVVFNTEFALIQPVTKDQYELFTAINSISAQDNTAMYDALIMSIDLLEGVGGRTAIIVLTDGLDNISSAILQDVISRIGPSGMSISSIGLGESDQSRSAVTALDDEALIELAAQAGGVYGYAEDEDSLRILYQQYAVTLQSEYVITYLSPATLRDGVNRSVTVSLQDTALSNQVSVEDAKYNPGGLVPEVAQPAPWSLFAGLLASLLALLAMPSVYNFGRRLVGIDTRAKRKPKPRIKLID